MSGIQQDAEYLSAVKGLLIEAIEEEGPGRDDDYRDVIAERIMNTVRSAGLVLVTEADFQSMVDAYIMQALR